MTLNVKSDFYKQGFNLAIDNAKNLMGVSVKAAETHDFGIACSLNILATEESLKAFFLIIKQYNPNDDIINFDKIFHSHSIKHEELERLILYAQKIQVTNEKFLKMVEPFLDSFEKQTEDYKRRNKELLDSVYDDYNWFKKEQEKKLDFEQILVWLKEANIMKNKGLYVDKRKEKWFSPKDISQGKFEEGKKYAEAIFEYVSEIEELFIRQLRAKNFR